MDEAKKETQKEKPKLNWLAVSAFLLSLAGLCTVGISSIISIFIGIYALIKIRKHPGSLRGRGFALAGITLSAIVLPVIFWNSIPSVKAQKVLRAGRLATLPKSAGGLKVHSWSSLFSGKDYIKFTATPEDIEKFITESSSIRNVTPELFNSKHMHLPHPENTDFENEADFENYTKHKYYWKSKDDKYTPSWYKPTIKVKRRMYRIPGDPNMRGHNWGSVIINDEANTVYINVIWS